MHVMKSLTPPLQDLSINVSCHSPLLSTRMAQEFYGLHCTPNSGCMDGTLSSRCSCSLLHIGSSASNIFLLHDVWRQLANANIPAYLFQHNILYCYGYKCLLSAIETFTLPLIDLRRLQACGQALGPSLATSPDSQIIGAHSDYSFPVRAA